MEVGRTTSKHAQCWRRMHKAGIVSFVILGLEKRCTEDAVLSDFAVSKFDALLVCLWLIVGTAQLASAAHFVSRLGAGVTVRQMQADDDFPLEV